MTAEGSDAAERRTAIAKAIVAHRKAGSESPVRFVAGSSSGDEAADSGSTPSDDRPAVEYRDREITVWVDGDERDRLDALLEDFHVFKIAQPATRKAPDGEIHCSAIADPKHAADFLDRLFLDVFERSEGYDLRVEK
ncbi:hypothetical protein BV210_13090 [Halorientalis sp. IM1011]|uniref:hypothetical protein n=1 Tax=Halorientalis sp. IM1011 TaxID=1932360 RepID=UPI00097CC541|nr:hypothetical protein [Halorientalis sp. IM1011]AQL43573.1 hypothetical protein BV210_13090 [Halorientalis sp. IM1011]